MKRKITISLAFLFLFFGCGGLVAAFQFATTTALFQNLIKLHQIEDLRHTLVQNTLKALTALHTVRTPLDLGLDAIVENVGSLEATASACFACHHQPEIAGQLGEMRTLIRDFEDRLSFYITTAANRELIDSLKMEASLAGNRLLSHAEKMSFTAANNVNSRTDLALSRVAQAKTLLALTLVLSFLFSVAIAVHLSKSITRPVSTLVDATRKIAQGRLGYAVQDRFHAEFGELAQNFNDMSRSLKDSYAALQREIGERRETEAALRHSEERYALAARGANDGLWDWDLKSNAIYFSPRWLAMLGLAAMESGRGPENWLRLVHADDRQRLAAKISGHIEGFSDCLEDEHRVVLKDGSCRWMLVRGIAERDAGGVACRMAGSQTDITERKRAEERLLHDAFHDALTGLPNRALFLDRLDQALKTAQRHASYRFAVLFFNLDRFKNINDSLGHRLGDRLLATVATRLSGYLRPNDTVARMGGDEFAILLEDIHGEEDARGIAQRIQGELPQPMRIEGQEVTVTGSIGITLNTPDYQRPDELLRDASLAMYRAKGNGKARCELFEPSMYAGAMRRLQLETDLRTAVERNEFHLVYQPIVSLRTERISGFEALIRWDHPTLGVVSPVEFIPLAEESGLIAPIGLWVLREACRQASRWQKDFPPPLPTINVNLSSQEFTPSLLDEIKAIFAETGIVPATLRLEITERTLMHDPLTAAALLLQLRQLGIGLHIDDFGTGYSSLSYLHQFPVDTLKIDRSFIEKMHVEKEHSEIVKTIIALAGSLKMQIVAEGVETGEQLQAISDLGCELVQGYVFYHPMQPEEIAALLRADAPLVMPGKRKEIAG
ncbi:MAG: EAL domain-containing protein [Desulfuromonadales bacterium]